MSVYSHRNGWQARVTVKGQKLTRNFAAHEKQEAEAWAASLRIQLANTHEPLLGGPSRTTLARALLEYARLHSIHKRGVARELTRINRYLLAAGLPTLSVEGTDDTRINLVETPPPTLPRTFAAHQASRARARKKTNAMRAALAQTLVSKIGPDKLLKFKACMKAEGLSDSTIQKELALLKHLFNCARGAWNWAGFDNPMHHVEVPQGGPGREAVLADADEAKLFAALGRSTNPFILPIVQFAIETTARRGNLLRLRWSDIDLSGRTALLHQTKNGDNHLSALTRRAVEILARLPREARDGRVFPITDEALDAAWERATQEAALTHLRFHDLRHIGTTRHARRLRNPQLLKRITGHKTAAMLERYSHLYVDDTLAALDATEPEHQAPLPPNHRARPARAVRSENWSRIHTAAPRVPETTASAPVLAVDFRARRRMA